MGRRGRATTNNLQWRALRRAKELVRRPLCPSTRAARSLSTDRCYMYQPKQSEGEGAPSEEHAHDLSECDEGACLARSCSREHQVYIGLVDSIGFIWDLQTDLLRVHSALQHLYTRPWFRRIWVQQEIFRGSRPDTHVRPARVQMVAGKLLSIQIFFTKAARQAAELRRSKAQAPWTRFSEEACRYCNSSTHGI
jgi:hypothetical protein